MAHGDYPGGGGEVVFFGLLLLVAIAMFAIVGC